MRSHAKASSAGSTQRQAKAPSVRRLSSLVVVLAVGLVSMGLISSPASATKTHLFKEIFASAAQPNFDAARGLAIDQSSGDLLVMDAGGTPSIKRYNPDGTPDDFAALATNVIDGQGTGDETPQNGLNFGGAAESQIAVDRSGGATDGNIYVTQGFPNLINVFADDGEYLGQLTAAGATPFSEACGVAVDPAGAVYVGDYSAGIHKFVPAANPPVNADNTATFTSVSTPCTLAAGTGPSAGFLFAAKYGGPISKLDSTSGELKYEISPKSHLTVSVDPASGLVYGATGDNAINAFDASDAGSATQVSTFNLSSLPLGVAVNGSGELYLSRQGSDKAETFGPTVTIPDVVTGSASSIDETTATLNGTVNPDGVALEECKFEYGTSTSYGQSISCAESVGAIGTGTDPVPVHADISGLSISTTYHFRLVAKNANETVEGEDGEFESLSIPAIREQWAQDVVYNEATLKAKINPKGFASTYRIEYGPTDSYGQSTAEFSIGSDATDHVVTRAFEALAPGSTYHYRFVATNEIGVSEGSDHTFSTYEPFAPDTNCANQGFRTGAALNLADCRGYEMVSPVDKGGGEVGAGLMTGGYDTAFTQGSIDGEKITYSSSTAFGDEASGHYTNQYIATRGAGGWINHGINAPQGVTIFDPSISPFIELQPYFTGFTEDLSSGWMVDYNKVPLTAGGLANYVNLYRRDNTDDSLEALIVDDPLRPANSILGEVPFGVAHVQGFSADGSRSVFVATAKLTPDASDSDNRQVYEFSDGELHLVSVLPNGEPSALRENNVGQPNEGTYIGPWRAGFRRHAVSDDGSRIFWTAESFEGRTIYARIDGETTVRVSPTGPMHWWTASTDGSKALFSEDPGEDHEILKLSDVDSETTTTIAGELDGVAGASDDLSYIYFASREDLDAGATPGKPNLYVSHNGTVTFIATLLSDDVSPPNEWMSNTVGEPGHHAARVTPDGSHLAFESTLSLSDYDNTDVLNGKPDMEVYLYDADSGQLTCASCNPTGGRPVGKGLPRAFSLRKETDRTGRWAAAWLNPEGSNYYSSRLLSSDGNRLFFNAFDALVPQDGNEAQDVYEWRRQGTGGCQKVDGCISLVSAGEGPKRSQFVDASADGSDVFFETSSSIDPRDPGLVDIYDARVGGGYPYVGPSEPCVGDACQSPPPAPNDPTPASASFHGAGNPPARKARRHCRARGHQASKSKGKARRKAGKSCRRAGRRGGR